jgi:hypothetical protein
MLNHPNVQTRQPRLKERPTHPTILSIIPKPPTVQRDPPALLREVCSPKSPKSGEQTSPKEAIDYDKLTPTQQAKWDAGMYGSIHLRSDKVTPYYCVRWRDPKTKRQRSQKLGTTYKEAVAALKKLTRGN